MIQCSFFLFPWVAMTPVIASDSIVMSRILCLFFGLQPKNAHLVWFSRIQTRTSFVLWSVKSKKCFSKMGCPHATGYPETVFWDHVCLSVYNLIFSLTEQDSVLGICCQCYFQLFPRLIFMHSALRWHWVIFNTWRCLLLYSTYWFQGGRDHGGVLAVRGEAGRHRVLPQMQPQVWKGR